MLVLDNETVPSRTMLCAAAGGFEVAHISLTQAIHMRCGKTAPEQLTAQSTAYLTHTKDRSGSTVAGRGAAQGANEMRLARRQ